MTGFAVVDVETTGLHPSYHHRIIELGVVLTDEHGEVEHRWTTLVNPHRDLGPTDIHGVSAAMVGPAPPFSDVAGDLSVLLDQRVLVAHNAMFDVGFLEAEWGRLGRDWAFEALCTMQLARRRGLPPKLVHCCAAAGIEHDGPHRALADAEATALLLKVLSPLPAELPNAVRIPPALPPWSGVACPRPDSPVRARSGLLPALLDRLPDYRGHGLDLDTDSVDAYRDVLDRALEDRVFTAVEVAELVTVAEGCGLDLADVEAIHHSVVVGLVAIAAADGVVTDAELADLRRVGDLLGVDDITLDAVLDDAPRLSSAVPDARVDGGERLAGSSVCFTGSSQCSVDGEPLTRQRATLLAAAAGLVIAKSVTKKLDILVLADPDTESSKARKAREYGTRIIAERAFWPLLGYSVD